MKPSMHGQNQRYCTLEEIEKLHKIVNYSTRTADDDIQYLSILVCAQPYICLESLNKAEKYHTTENQKDSDEQITVEETNEDNSEGIKAVL